MSRHTIIGKSNMKQKFFSQISDHQQSVAPAPSRDLPLLVVADFFKLISETSNMDLT
jgi:hypothetical protein